MATEVNGPPEENPLEGRAHLDWSECSYLAGSASTRIESSPFRGLQGRMCGGALCPGGQAEHATGSTLARGRVLG